ncbi:MAG: transcriptional regulator, DeoR family [Naasia sp.]|jgi:proteasome accessory factor C|uniref:helix-turn-helix transcriptional regulator n=1 Tax=Naasia sp. TaxID=2546198 RepID=UPI00260D1E90|nr:WYL domain-containing protein [Naasia sp.]MCU1570552.1 transcriptional regulator, DeoR family [Naasia sp.]
MSARPLQAQDKLAFLLSLVPYLIDHDGVSVAAAAAQFGVSEQEMRTAVELIAVSGIPGGSGQYQHGDLFDIDWDEFEENGRIILTHSVAIDEAPRFSAREAAALIAGLQYLSALPENGDRAALASLTAKLARGASSAPSPVAVSVRGIEDALAPLRDAVVRHVQVEFDYRDAQGETEHRTVDPLRLDSDDESWYLRGWDHLREAVRTFRLDRMSGIAVSDRAVTPASGEVTLPDVLFETSSTDLTVVVEVAEAALPLLGDYLPEGTRTQPGRGPGLVQATMRVGHYAGLKRLVARLAGMVTVLAPDDARAAVADWARAGLAEYGESTEEGSL